MDTKKLAGSLKVAILIQSMAEVEAQNVLERLSDSERELIKKHLSQMGMISPDVVEKVAREFTEIAEQSKSHKSKKNIVMKGEKSDSTLKAPSLEILQSLETARLIQLIKDEHPQTIAIIIVHLKTEIASKVLSELPDEIKTDVALRIANLDRVVSGMVEEIDKVFEDVLKKSESSATQKAGGVDCLAEILNQTDGISGELILGELEERDPDLADEIKQKMFVFEDLILVDDSGFQKVLRQVDTKELGMALKAASDEVKEKVFRNMSGRAAEILKEEVETMGAVRMTEVAEAQQGITKIIRDMEAKKELLIGGRKGEEFVG